MRFLRVAVLGGRIDAQRDGGDTAGRASGQRDVTVMKLGNSIGSAETKTETSARFASAEVGIEGMLASNVGKSWAAVGNMDHHAIWFANERDNDRALAADRFDRVSNQRADSLADHLFINDGLD